MKRQLYNLPKLKRNRRALRNNLTSAEAILWRSIKNRQLEGRRFRRQFSIGPYILDFYCPKEKLGVELDGAYHFTEAGNGRDVKRDKYLSELGITIIRIENKNVFLIHEQVLEFIRGYFRAL